MSNQWDPPEGIEPLGITSTPEGHMQTFYNRASRRTFHVPVGENVREHLARQSDLSAPTNQPGVFDRMLAGTAERNMLIDERIKQAGANAPFQSEPAVQRQVYGKIVDQQRNPAMKEMAARAAQLRSEIAERQKLLADLESRLK